MPPPVRVRIVEWGAHAGRFARRHASARVVAVFARSLYLQGAEDFMCIGEKGIGSGPLNATVRAADWRRLATALPTPGDVAHLAAHGVQLGHVVLETGNARLWLPAAWPAADARGGARRLARALDAVQAMVRERAPADGLVRAALRMPPGGDHDPAAERLRRVADPKIAALSAWLCRRLRGHAEGPAPVDLLGLGPGLTPSGDDLLGGVLIALRAAGRPDAAQDFDWHIACAAAGATTPLSCAFLRAAAEGMGCAALHGAIAALLKNERAALASHVTALARIGHTSGWDALAGVVLALQAVAGTRAPAPAP